MRSETRTPLFQRSMRLRRGVERLFADAKGKRGLVRLHLRGQRGADAPARSALRGPADPARA